MIVAFFSFFTLHTLQAVTAHNIAYMMRLVRGMRKAILAGKYADYTRTFMSKYFPGTRMLGIILPRLC